MNADLLKRIIEGALLAAGKPPDIGKMENLFEEGECPPRDQIRAALEEIEADCRGRGFELMQTASGYRFQVRQDLADGSIDCGLKSPNATPVPCWKPWL